MTDLLLLFPTFDVWGKGDKKYFPIIRTHNSLIHSLSLYKALITGQLSGYQPNKVFFVSLSPANPVSCGQGNHYILSSIFRKMIKLKSPPTVWWSLGSHEDAAGAVSWLPVEYLMKFKLARTGSQQTRDSVLPRLNIQSTDTREISMKNESIASTSVPSMIWWCRLVNVTRLSPAGVCRDIGSA